MFTLGWLTRDWGDVCYGRLSVSPPAHNTRVTPEEARCLLHGVRLGSDLIIIPPPNIIVDQFWIMTSVNLWRENIELEKKISSGLICSCLLMFSRVFGWSFINWTLSWKDQDYLYFPFSFFVKLKFRLILFNWNLKQFFKMIFIKGSLH